MEIITVKNKFQIVIPQHVRELVPVEVCAFLEAAVEDGKITFTPKSLVDRHLAEGLEDMQRQNSRAYADADTAISALDARAKRHNKKLRP